MNIFVIIVTFNGIQWYDKCFGSLKLSLIHLKTIVVDNKSDKNSIDYIKKNFPEIHLIESDSNLGFGQANNVGIRYALEQGADYVFLLNQDAWIEPNTIARLVEIHKHNTDFGILSPMHLNASKTKIEDGLMHYIADYHITSPELINDMYFHQLSEIYETNYVNAAAWLLPRRTLEIVGGFDPIFFHYGEDDNYMQRVHFHGLKIGICPNISICHDTEIRVSVNLQTKQNFKKYLLVEITNVNNKNSILTLVVAEFKKAIFKAIKFKFHLAKIYISYGFYKLKLIKKIKKSIIQNRKSAASWL